MDLGRIGTQRQITVVAAVETWRRVTAHDALQQYATSKLQAPAFEEARRGHHLAARHAVQIRGHALDFIDAAQKFFQCTAANGVHLFLSLVAQRP
ncbi:hypothetical protein D3C86_1598980 [compost metagenome]